MSYYHEVADKTMDHLLESLEELHEVESMEGYEVEFHVRDLSTSLISRQLIYQHFSLQSGVLTLNLGPHGTYVVNKQPPNKQIWLSSPFRYVARPHNGRSLFIHARLFILVGQSDMTT